jgi:hypothetical protein
MNGLAIFCSYLILFTWLLGRIPFVQRSQLGTRQIAALFLLKVAAGLAYAWFYAQPEYLYRSDTHALFRDSIPETQLLLSHPLDFITGLFTHGYQEQGNLFAGYNSYWNDLKNNILIKLLAFINLATGANYYANIVWLNAIYFLGFIAAYRFFKFHAPKAGLIVVWVLFITPSLLFYTSGAYKDGLLFTCLSFTIYQFNALLYLQDKRFLRIGLLFLTLLLAFGLRNYIALACLPALLAWYLSFKYTFSPLKVFGLTYLVGIVLFFGSTFIHPRLNFPRFILNKQTEFNLLLGDSRKEMPLLNPNAASFIAYLPSAADMALLEPRPPHLKKIYYWPPFIENLVLLSLLLWSIFFTSNRWFKNPAMLASVAIACTLLLIAGYTVNFYGSIIRYRSIAIPFLYLPIFIFARSRWNNKID